MAEPNVRTEENYNGNHSAVNIIHPSRVLARILGHDKIHRTEKSEQKRQNKERNLRNEEEKGQRNG